jgi:hypothetical protein
MVFHDVSSSAAKLVKMFINDVESVNLIKSLVSPMVAVDSMICDPEGLGDGLLHMALSYWKGHEEHEYTVNTSSISHS